MWRENSGDSDDFACTSAAGKRVEGWLPSLTTTVGELKAETWNKKRQSTEKQKKEGGWGEPLVSKHKESFPILAKVFEPVNMHVSWHTGSSGSRFVISTYK